MEISDHFERGEITSFRLGNRENILFWEILSLFCILGVSVKPMTSVRGRINSVNLLIQRECIAFLLVKGNGEVQSHAFSWAVLLFMSKG